MTSFTLFIWLLFIAVSVVCYGGYTYFVSKTSGGINPDLILEIPKQ